MPWAGFWKPAHMTRGLIPLWAYGFWHANKHINTLTHSLGHITLSLEGVMWCQCCLQWSRGSPFIDVYWSLNQILVFFSYRHIVSDDTNTSEWVCIVCFHVDIQYSYFSLSRGFKDGSVSLLVGLSTILVQTEVYFNNWWIIGPVIATKLLQMCVCVCVIRFINVYL